MHITYLILAHDHPDQLERLVRRLINDGPAQILIHIDAKSDITRFRGISGSCVSFVEHRFPIYWGEFGMIEASLELLRRALCMPTDRLVLMSGADYPIRRREIVEAFLASADLFVNAKPMPTRGKPLSRLDRFHPRSDRPVRKTMQLVLRKIIPAAINRDHRLYLGDLVPFGGSQWWALSDKVGRKILRYCDEHPELLDFFQNTSVPDETFFQTLMCNLPGLGARCEGLTYTDWQSGVPHPRTLGVEDIAMFIRRGQVARKDASDAGRNYCFVRKMPADDHQNLADMIDDAFRVKAL